MKIAGLPGEERRKIADHFIALVGLTDFSGSLPKTLSGRHEAALRDCARASAVNPKIC